MLRRDLLRKLGIGALLAPAVITALPEIATAEPKPQTGEWYVAAGPICPECGMMMDTSPTDKDGRHVFMHPELMGATGKPWPCKNAGRKFYLPTQQLEEYHGEMKRRY